MPGGGVAAAGLGDGVCGRPGAGWARGGQSDRVSCCEGRAGAGTSFAEGREVCGDGAVAGEEGGDEGRGRVAGGDGGRDSGVVC